MTNMTTHPVPLARFLAERKAELRAEYPEAERDEVAALLMNAREQWFREVVQYERGAVIPASVYKSYRYHLGPVEASRAFRYAGNFAQLANLPVFKGEGEPE